MRGVRSYELHRYSPAIRANGLLFFSGQVGSRPDGSPEPELDDQVRLAFQNLNAILAAPGCSFKDVAVGVTWLSGFQFEIKVIAKLPGVVGS